MSRRSCPCAACPCSTRRAASVPNIPTNASGLIECRPGDRRRRYEARRGRVRASYQPLRNHQDRQRHDADRHPARVCRRRRCRGPDHDHHRRRPRPPGGVLHGPLAARRVRWIRTTSIPRSPWSTRPPCLGRQTSYRQTTPKDPREVVMVKPGRVLSRRRDPHRRGSGVVLRPLPRLRGLLRMQLVCGYLPGRLHRPEHEGAGHRGRGRRCRPRHRIHAVPCRTQARSTASAGSRT